VSFLRNPGFEIPDTTHPLTPASWKLLRNPANDASLTIVGANIPPRPVSGEKKGRFASGQATQVSFGQDAPTYAWSVTCIAYLASPSATRIDGALFLELLGFPTIRSSASFSIQTANTWQQVTNVLGDIATPPAQYDVRVEILVVQANSELLIDNVNLY
jgi:hypothetical protein